MESNHSVEKRNNDIKDNKDSRHKNPDYYIDITDNLNVRANSNKKYNSESNFSHTLNLNNKSGSDNNSSTSNNNSDISNNSGKSNNSLNLNYSKHFSDFVSVSNNITEEDNNNNINNISKSNVEFAKNNYINKNSEVKTKKFNFKTRNSKKKDNSKASNFTKSTNFEEKKANNDVNINNTSNIANLEAINEMKEYEDYSDYRIKDIDDNLKNSNNNSNNAIINIGNKLPNNIDNCFYNKDGNNNNSDSENSSSESTVESSDYNNLYVKDLDEFFKNIYTYYELKGFKPIFIRSILDSTIILFIIHFIFFGLFIINWNNVFDTCNGNQIKDDLLLSKDINDKNVTDNSTRYLSLEPQMISEYIETNKSSADSNFIFDKYINSSNSNTKTESVLIDSANSQTNKATEIINNDNNTNCNNSKYKSNIENSPKNSTFFQLTKNIKSKISTITKPDCNFFYLISQNSNYFRFLITPSFPTFLYYIFILYFFILTTRSFILVHKLRKIKVIFENKLNITEDEIENVVFEDIIEKLILLQSQEHYCRIKESITRFDIISRITRRDNFLTMLLSNNLVDFSINVLNTEKLFNSFNNLNSCYQNNRIEERNYINGNLIINDIAKNDRYCKFKANNEEIIYNQYSNNISIKDIENPSSNNNSNNNTKSQSPFRNSFKSTIKMIIKAPATIIKRLKIQKLLKTVSFNISLNLNTNYSINFIETAVINYLFQTDSSIINKNFFSLYHFRVRLLKNFIFELIFLIPTITIKIVLFLLRNAESLSSKDTQSSNSSYYNNNDFSGKSFSPNMLCLLKNYNELKEDFEVRVSKSKNAAFSFSSLFVSQVANIIYNFVSLICGSLLIVIFIISINDESMISKLHIFGVSLLYVIIGIGFVLGYIKSNVSSNNNKSINSIFTRNNSTTIQNYSNLSNINNKYRHNEYSNMNVIEKNLAYKDAINNMINLPDRFICSSSLSQKNILIKNTLHYSYYLVFKEILSIMLLPIFYIKLIFNSSGIIGFIKKNIINIPGIGDVPAFCCFTGVDGNVNNNATNNTFINTSKIHKNNVISLEEILFGIKLDSHITNWFNFRKQLNSLIMYYVSIFNIIISI